MAALTPTTPANAGTAVTAGPVAASDTVALSAMGPHGAYLEVINGNASPDSMTISDAGQTPAGNALAGGTFPASVTNGTSKIFWLRRDQANPATGLVTVTHSVTATVTYKLYPV